MDREGKEKLIINVVVGAAMRPMAFSGAVGGTCGSKYCQVCQVFSGKAWTEPASKLRTAKVRKKADAGEKLARRGNAPR